MIFILSQTIAEKDKLLSQLKESEKRFKALHNASFGGIAIHDNGVILECNRGMSDLTGYAYDELIGKKLLQLIAVENRENVEKSIGTTCEKPCEAMGVTKIGGLYPLRLEARNIPYRSKNVTVVEFRDITEQKRAEEEKRDDGAGISPDILDRIFEPYFTTKDVGEGLGMGLAVVHGIIKKHEGSIKVQSQVGKGTTVEVRLPMIDEQPTPGDEETEAPAAGTERILFVDDESSMVKMATQMLIRLGYEVVGRTSSQDALNLFKKNPERFDLVITDMTMPEMTGDELARRIIQSRPDIPIILCTGHSDLMDETRAAAVGVKAFAMKPLTKSDLTATVRKVLDE